MAKGFLIGETLLGQIKDTVKRVDGMPEGGNITRIPTRFESMPVAANEKVFRICTFTGAWSINSAKTVTFKNQTTTPNTVSAVNLFLTLPDNGERNCAVSKDGTAWYLTQWQWDVAHAFTAASITTTGIEFLTAPVAALATSGTTKVTLTAATEDVIVGATLGSSLEFSRKRVGVLFTSTANTVSISITTCSTATAS